MIVRPLYLRRDDTLARTAGDGSDALFAQALPHADVTARLLIGKLRWAILSYIVANGVLPNAGSERDLKISLSDYLIEPFPICPVGANQNDEIDITTSTTLPLAVNGRSSKSWRYSSMTGHLIINSDDASIVYPTLTYDYF